MSDGDPAQRATDEMADWLDRNRPAPDASGPLGAFGRIGLTAANLIDAAGAGAFAMEPDSAQAVMRRLTEVQDEVANMRLMAVQAAVDPKFGGGYAEDVGRFIQGVAAGQAGSAEDVLTKFRDELEQLKEAVARSIRNYQAMDDGSAHRVADAGNVP
ncbi:MAG TPA: hypothetical protein VGR06_11235 [Actinophytocola sp.]|uniref:hypothetical protein n=1 Tax=Actinophytocola sp. TaxID=1872138 RepID=UPI002E060184|nr:hypothetical protein [Actinophytocola sp.]